MNSSSSLITLNDILCLRKHFEFEDGFDTLFGVAFQFYVHKMKDSAISAIRHVLEHNYNTKSKNDLTDWDVAEMLIWLGDYDYEDDGTYDERIAIIKMCTKFDSVFIRDMAVSALTYADIYDVHVYEELLEKETSEDLCERLNKLIDIIYDG